jgi:hypothetical protein
MNQTGLKTTTNLFAAVAIALTGMVLPAMAQDTPAPDSPAEGVPAVEQAVPTQDPLCRAANRSTPIFESNSTISSALRLVPPDGLVRLVAVPPTGSQFAQINLPVAGYIQTAVLKSCGAPPPPPRTSCRVLRMPEAVNVRSAPTVNQSNVIASLLRGQRVFVVLDANGNVVSRQADGYNWVQVDLTNTPFFRPSGTGWLYNSIVGSPNSNLAFCQ